MSWLKAAFSFLVALVKAFVEKRKQDQKERDDAAKALSDAYAKNDNDGRTPTDAFSRLKDRASKEEKP